LEFLKAISKNIIIAKYFGINETIIQERELIEFFHEIRTDKENKKPTQDIFKVLAEEHKKFFSKINLKSILPNKEELTKSESGKLFFKQFESFSKSGDFISLLQDVSNFNERFQNNPQDFNDLRKGLKDDLKLDKNISNWDSVIQKLDSYLPNSPLHKSFSESVNEGVAIFHKEPIFFDYYISAYNQLGLFSFRPDNLSKKNRFNNSIEDSFHSFYGAHSTCFITNDKILYHRSKALFEAFQIDAKLINTFEVDNLSRLNLELENILEN